LDVTAEVKENTHILFWQELTLIRGVQYQFPGAFAEIGGTISNFWCEILLGPGLDYKEPIWVGFHPWEGHCLGLTVRFRRIIAKVRDLCLQHREKSAKPSPCILLSMSGFGQADFPELLKG